MAKKEPWTTRCMYVSEKGAKCKTVTPRNWSHCASHSFTLGEQLDQTRGAVSTLPSGGR